MSAGVQHQRERLGDLAMADLESVVALEGACHPMPWSRGMLAEELVRPDSVNLGAWHDGNELVGMLLAAGLADAWHILDVAVEPRCRRRGIASVLLARLFERTAGTIERGYTLEVRPSNPGALALYARHGFEAVGTRPRYYADGEDAVVMWRPPQAILAARARGEAAAWEPPT